MSPRPFKRWAMRLGLALAGTAGAVVLAEIALRVAGYERPVFYEYDAVLGAVLRPGAAGRQTREGEAHVRVNSHGWRDVERSAAKPPGVFRILILGDSFAEAMQVPLESAFPQVLERELAGCAALAGRRPEVVNFSVSGWGTAQELLALRRRAREWSPDLVLLAFDAANDVVNNSPALEPDRVRPFFTVKDGALASDESFRESARFRRGTSWLWRRARAASDASRVVQLLFAARGGGGAGAGAAAPACEADAGIDPAIYREPSDPRWREAWEITERLIVAMRDEARAMGARFAVATLSTPAQVHPDRSVREAACRAVGVADLYGPDRRIAALGDREGIPVLNLAGEMAREAVEGGVFFHGFANSVPGAGHWNEDGHRVAGRRLAGWLCEKLRKFREGE